MAIGGGGSRKLEVVIAGDASGAIKAFADVEQSGGGLGQKLAGLGKTAAAGLVGAVGVVGVQGVRAFADFEKGMNEVFTLIPGTSKKAMDEMSGQVLQFSKDFGVLPDQVVPALYQSLSAGVPPGNVFDFLETAQKAAKGGVTDLSTAVDGISSVVNAYGTDVLSATEASDLMFTAVKLGKTNFEELSKSLFNVTPVTAALGVDFADVTAALSAMTAQGIPTSVATTQLRGMFVELSKEGTKTSTVFEQIAGKSFKQFVAEGGNTQDALKLLEQYAKDTGVGINDLFGSVEAGGAALALTGKGTESFSKAIDGMKSSAGATDEAFKTMSGGLSASWDKIRANVQVALIQIGAALAPFVETATAWFAENLPGILRGAGEAFTRLKDGIATFVAQASEVIGGFVSTAQAFWRTFGDSIVQFAAGAWEQVKGVIQGALDVVRGIIQTVTALIHGDWGQAWDGIKQIVEGVWTAITGLVQGFIDQTRGIIEAGWTVISGVVSAALDGIIGFVSSLPGRAAGALGSLAGTVGGVVSGAWSAITGIVTGALDGIVGFVAGLPGRAAGALGSLGSAIGGVVRAAWDGVTSIISGAIDGWMGLLRGVGGRVSSAISGAFDGIKSAFSSAIDFVKGVWNRFVGIWNGIQVRVPGVKIPFGPTVGGFTVGLPDLPRLAKGGIVTEPTVALIGEDGPEAVVPLDRARGFGGGPSFGDINITINGANDPQATAREVRRALLDLQRRNGNSGFTTQRRYL